MLSHLNNIELKKNILLNSDHNVYYDVYNFNFYQSILNKYKKNLLNKEIKFDNIATKKKKKDDENIVSTNFIVNNLLNILNTKNFQNAFYIKKNTNINDQKKKLDKNIILKYDTYLKNKEKINIEKNENKYKIFKNNETLKYSVHVKNKNFLFSNYNIINLFKKSFNQNTFKKISNVNISKRKISSIQDGKNFIYFKNHINNITRLSKNTHQNQYSIYAVHSLKKKDENSFLRKSQKSILILNNKENVGWKKAISQKVLLSIANKENAAEIRLNPESLGSIYIKIKIKDHQAKLKFISDNIGIKNFLNNCIPFLKSSLSKNGIVLKKVNIYSSFDSDTNKNLIASKNTPRTSSIIKKFFKNLTQNQNIDMYV